jgi:hypothetical protein
MSRNTGTFNFAANFEGLIKAPIDAKQLVGTYADLTLPATWCASGQVWLYDGAIVAVSSDVTPSNNGIYFLKDSLNYTNTCSWIKVSSGGGTALTGATNGLSVSGQNVKLGGTLLNATTINGSGQTLNINVNDLNLIGTTIDITGIVTLQSTPLSGTTTDAILVWNSVDKKIKQISQNIVNVCNVFTTYTATTNSSFIGVSGASLIYLLNTPYCGQRVTVADICGNALSSPITICSNKRINDNLSCTSLINTNYGSITFIFNGYFWSAVAFIN